MLMSTQSAAGSNPFLHSTFGVLPNSEVFCTCPTCAQYLQFDLPVDITVICPKCRTVLLVGPIYLGKPPRVMLVGDGTEPAWDNETCKWYHPQGAKNGQ
jgi:hypothetical protein